jgi:hypothetical protein
MSLGWDWIGWNLEHGAMTDNFIRTQAESQFKAPKIEAPAKKGRSASRAGL